MMTNTTMTAFPDMKVWLDELRVEDEHVIYAARGAALTGHRCDSLHRLDDAALSTKS
jgi:hypothetical protein